LLQNFLEKNHIGEVIYTPGLILSEFSGVIPDIVFFSHEQGAQIISGERLTGPPDLVIEILCPGSENIRRDRVAKRQLYGKHGVGEYWLVDPEKRDVEVYRLQSGNLNLVATLVDDNELFSPALPGFKCRVTDIFKQ
jgi:Uma2 family endonuclease